ncbi:MAG TPA: putative quinol monooxygenase [Nocardioidaceae bacterium]|nr:putative quinol monooxygenase [Nocardioidaceae bacterium]
MPTAPAIVFASFTPRPERIPQLRATLDVMVEHTRREPGCQIYDLYESDDGKRLHLFERYVDADALEAHRASEHYKAYRAKLPELLASPIEVAVLSEADVA